MALRGKSANPPNGPNGRWARRYPPRDPSDAAGLVPAEADRRSRPRPRPGPAPSVAL